jgi:hypothetical protein
MSKKNSKAQAQAQATTAQAIKAVVLVTASHIGTIPGAMLARLLASISSAAAAAVETARSNKRAAAVAAYDVAEGDETLCGWLCLLAGVGYSYRLGRVCVGECNALRGCNKYARWISGHAEMVRQTRDNASLISASKAGMVDICNYVEQCSNEGKALQVSASADYTDEERNALADFNTALSKLPGVWQAHKAKLAKVQVAAVVSEETVTQ